MTSQWYDPEALDKHFSLFDQGEAYDIDDDEFSLPDVEDDAASIPAVGEDQGPKQPKKRLSKPQNSSGGSVGTPTMAQGQGRISPVDARSSNLSTESQPKHQPSSSIVRKSTDTVGSGATPKIPAGLGPIKPGKFIPGFSIVGKSIRCCDSPSSGVDVRQKNYKKTGQKAPSGTSLYEFMTLDVLRGKQKISKVYTYMHIPWISETQPPDPSGLPEILIVNLQIPNKGPQMFRSSSSDIDPGTSVVYYFKLRHPVAKSDPAVSLAARFFAGTVPGRFKAMSFIDNLNELKFPSFLSGTMNKFNGKPVIIHKTGTFHREGPIYEVDVDVFQFPVLARTALSSTRGSQANARTRAAFVLQGDTDEELPERLLGCCEVRNLDLDSSAYETSRHVDTGM